MDKSKLKIQQFQRKFKIDDEYREKMLKDASPIKKDNLMTIMSDHTRTIANYLVDFQRLWKEYKGAKRTYDVIYSTIYDFYRYDPSNDIEYYNPKVDRNDKNLVQAVIADADIQQAQEIIDEVEAETKMMEEYLKAFQNRGWMCKNILDLMKFEAGEFG